MSYKVPIDTRLEYEFGDDVECFMLMTLLLIKSASKDSVFKSGRKLVNIKRGQVVFGRKAWAKYFGGSEMRAMRALQRLENVHNKVHNKSNTNYTIVELLNYEDLVSFAQVNAQVMHKKRTSNEQVMNTSEIEKNDKNVKSVKNITYITSDEALDENGYLQFWTQVVGTTLRTRPSDNVQAATRLVNMLGGTERLGEVLMMCRAIRGDKYAGKFLFTASQNYIQLEKNLEAVEAYGNGLVAQKGQSNQLLLMSKEEKAFFNL